MTVAVTVAAAAALPGATLASPTEDGITDGVTAQVIAQEVSATPGQGEFSDFLAGLLEKAPRYVVDFSWQGDHGVVLAAPEGESAVRGYAASQERAVRVAVRTSVPGAVPYVDRTAVELAAIEVLKPADAGYLAARYDAASDRVVVTVRTDDRAASALAIGRALAGQRAGAYTGPALTIEYGTADDLPREASTTQGGETYSTCTGGFVANRGSSYGITTSAHCTSKPGSYDGDTTGATYVASSNRDVRFTTLSGGTPQNQFRYNFGAYRTITSTGIVTTGALLFKFGKTTGYTSSGTTVESYAGCVTFSSGNVWCNLYYTESKVTEGGDSGGPWFVAYTGYAFTTGSNSGGSYITPIAYVCSISGCPSVKTS
ncbi:hypothetical protein ACN27F_05870 [Solwaraspora sp. WMMB335]|uniref:hypothetical protein n=1 Tax=Solwaraspora sp. WMMB335 TaxID=3404118 RepID=UPI003B965378